MPRSFDRRALGWLGLLGVLATPLVVTGCPGSLDPSLLQTGSGGAGGSGSSNCTGAMAGDALIAAKCATAGCHDTAGSTGGLGAGLDLTINATIRSRLVDVLSMGLDGSVCGGFTTPYLKSGSNPATGLLINKITVAAPNDALLCPMGSQMPFAQNPLPAAQQACIEQWAEGLIMAAQ